MPPSEMPRSFGSESDSIDPVYQWIDEKCSVVIVGIEGVFELSQDEILALGGGGVITHRVKESQKSICDPTIEFAAMVDDFWQMGIRLIVHDGLVFKWVYTEQFAPNSYLVARSEGLDDFVYSRITLSKNLSVARPNI